MDVNVRHDESNLLRIETAMLKAQPQPSAQTVKGVIECLRMSTGEKEPQSVLLDKLFASGMVTDSILFCSGFYYHNSYMIVEKVFLHSFLILENMRGGPKSHLIIQ